MKRTFITAALLTALLPALSATAMPDESQRQALQRAAAAKHKLEQAQSAKGSERKTLMSEHMNIMRDVMDRMQAMQPKPGMSMAEHEEWIAEHQQLMRQVMDQMMGEHHMMMQACDAHQGS